MIVHVLWVVLALILLACLALWLFQGRLVYFPVGELEGTPSDVGLEYLSLDITTADKVRIHGWFTPGPNHGAASDRAVLFFHGNGGNISHRLSTLAIIHDLGLSCLIIDYRGYGQSQGNPGEKGTYLDAEAAWEYLLQEQGYAPEQVIVWGRSLGGAIAGWLATEKTPAGLILESSFTSIPDMGAKLYPFLPVRLLSRIKYDTASRLPLLKCPVLVIHSPQDQVIPFEQGRELFRVAPEPKIFLEMTGGHNDGFMLSENYITGLEAWLEQFYDQPIPFSKE